LPHVPLRRQASFTATVGGNHTKTIEQNETITIHGSRTETVGADETITIHVNRTETIDKNGADSVKVCLTLVDSIFSSNNRLVEVQTFYENLLRCPV